MCTNRTWRSWNIILRGKSPLKKCIHSLKTCQKWSAKIDPLSSFPDFFSPKLYIVIACLIAQINWPSTMKKTSYSFWNTFLKKKIGNFSKKSFFLIYNAVFQKASILVNFYEQVLFYVALIWANKCHYHITQISIYTFHQLGPSGPSWSSSCNVHISIYLYVPFQCKFFLGLSLALRSHDQFQASHWSTLLPPPVLRVLRVLPVMPDLPVIYQSYESYKSY